jgi:hypothetical protein
VTVDTPARLKASVGGTLDDVYMRFTGRALAAPEAETDGAPAEVAA